MSTTGPFGETNTCTTIPADGSCTISTTFVPTATGAATGTLSVASSAPDSPLTVALSGTGINSSTNLALNQPVNDFPQWFQVDLGSPVNISSIVMYLPPSSAWNTRTQTITIQG